MITHGEFVVAVVYHIVVTVTVHVVASPTLLFTNIIIQIIIYNYALAVVVNGDTYNITQCMESAEHAICFKSGGYMYIIIL